MEYDEKYRIHQESLRLAHYFRRLYSMRKEGFDDVSNQDVIDALERYKECRRRLPVDERRDFNKVCRYRASEAYEATQGI